MDELTSILPKSALKPKNNDSAMLRALADDLNNPKLTGARLTPEQAAENEQILASEFAKAAAVENVPVEESAPEPVMNSTTPLPVPQHLFITGQPGAGILELVAGAPAGTWVRNINAHVSGLLQSLCMLSGTPSPAVINEFRKFGDGEFLPSLPNIFFLGLARKNTSADFGTPGFWARQVSQDAPGRVIVIGVRTSTEFKLLQAEGYAHYHAMASPTTNSQRSPEGVPSQLAHALDQDVHKKISVQRTGPRLNVIWTDPNPAPSGRFIDAKTFKEEVVGSAAPLLQSDSVSQIL